MSTELKITLTQMCSTNTHAGNIAVVNEHINAAAARGAELVCFPEVAGLLDKDKVSAARQITDEEHDPYISACRAAARSNSVWVHTGSTPVIAPGDDRFANRSHLIRPDGSVAAAYDKIHLFDVDLPDGTRIRESDRYAPGDTAVLAHTPWGPWGMSVCYDLRFPHLYRDYGKAGATVMFAPSAFAVKTGEAHWEVLARARAIENGCFIIASAQSGHHDDGRRTYGHAMVIDPWGTVLVDMRDEIGFTDLTLDLGTVPRTREMIPSLANERAYADAAAPALRPVAGDP